MIDPARSERLARAFERFLPEEDRARHPTYWAICRGVAADPSLLELADLVPRPQLPVNMLLASVHHLLLGGVDHELATHYRSVCARRDLAYRRVDDDALVASFTSFCHEQRDELVERLVARATQTNEVGRCALLRPVLALRGERDGVGLLDLGCSAGLNLLLDAYRCDYGKVAAGPVDGRVQLRCELTGATPPIELPAIEARTGLDLSPVDVAKDDEVAWLLACLWPDDLERFERLEQAVAVAAGRCDELDLHEGDMVDDLARVAATVRAPRLAILNCWSAAYLVPERRRALADVVAAIGATRPTTWITFEGPSVLHDLGVLPREVRPQRTDASMACVTEFPDGGAPASRTVAEVHAHGRWLDWRGPSAPAR